MPEQCSINGAKTMAQQWPESQWKITVIKAKGFIEKGINFDFGNKVKIGAIVNNKGDLKLLTRPSKTKSEKNTHHRMPSAAPNSMLTKDYINLIRQRGGY